MGTILILGRHEDPCCQLVEDALRREGRDVLLLAEDQLLPQMDFAWTPADGGGHVRHRDRDVLFSDVEGVLYRFYGVPIGADEFQTKDGQYLCSEWSALFLAWLNALPCRVVSRLQPRLWYRTRLDPTALGAFVPDLPFARPRTLMTTRSQDARVFLQRLGRPATYAALTGSAAYPVRDDEDWEKLTALNGALPLHLTEEVAGQACEAFVVGRTVLPVGPDGACVGPLPGSVSAHCVQTAQRLGLAFCQLSLVQADDGAWYCLALDRMPPLYGCLPDARRAIAGHVADLLVGVGGVL